MGGGIVGKDLLFVLFVGILFVVVFATQHGAPVCGLHFEVIVHEAQVDAVVLQFIFQQHIEFCAVDSLFQRFVGEAIDVVVDHFVDEVPLFEVSLSEGGFDGVVAERIECDRVLTAEGGLWGMRVWALSCTGMESESAIARAVLSSGKPISVSKRCCTSLISRACAVW